MTVEELARELDKVKGADRDKDVIAQLGPDEYRVVVAVEHNEDTFALATERV